jgi:hypothetical protein
VAALDDFVTRHSLADVVHLHYGTWQHAKARLTGILQEEFGDELLDLVADDCSHRYEQTKASFNVLFPRLRPGGLYLIEDWGSAHWPGDHWQGRKNQYANDTNPLSKLILELVMVSASRPGLVKEIAVDGITAYVTRGDEVVTDRDFDIGKSYQTAGRHILSRRTRLRIPTANEVRNIARRYLGRRPN